MKRSSISLFALAALAAVAAGPAFAQDINIATVGPITGKLPPSANR